MTPAYARGTRRAAALADDCKALAGLAPRVSQLWMESN